MRLLLLLLLVLAHALIAVQGLTAATRAPPPQTGPLLKDDAVTTEAAWSQIKVWRFEDTTPMDWLPPEEGFLEMPKPKKPPPKTPPPKKAAAKPVGPLQKATTRKPPTKPPAGSSTPRRPPTKPPAGSSTPRRPPTTSRPVRKARSLQELEQPAARVGRRLMALPDVLQAKAVDRRKADVFSASLSCMEGVFLGRQDAAVKTVMLLRRPRSVAGRPDQRHDHDQHNNHQDNHNNDHVNNKNNHNDHRSRHTGDYSDIIGDLHDGGGSGDGSGGGEPEEEKTAAPPPQDPGGRAQLPLWPDEPGGRDRPQDGDRLPDVGPGWAPGERGQGPAGPPNSFLGDRDSFFGGQGDFMGDNNAFHGGVGGNPTGRDSYPGGGGGNPTGRGSYPGGGGGNPTGRGSYPGGGSGNPTGRGSYLGGRDSPPGGGDSNLGGGGW